MSSHLKNKVASKMPGPTPFMQKLLDANKNIPGGKVQLKNKVRKLTPAEQKEKMKHWTKGPSKEMSEKDKSDYQLKTKRAYSE